MKVLRSELSMYVKPGSNYEHIKDAQANFMRTPLKEYKWIANRNNQHALAYYKYLDGLSYVLVKSDADLKRLVKNKPQDLLSQYVSTVIGCIDTIAGSPFNIVDIVWVDKAYQNQGYGEGLYRLAHQQSKKGIASSTNLGEQSLATWIRLYNKEPKVSVCTNDGEIPREQLRVKDIDIYWLSLNLCEPSADDFWFEWRK